MKTLFKNAKILTMVDDKIIDGDLLVADKRIAYIGKDIPDLGFYLEKFNIGHIYKRPEMINEKIHQDSTPRSLG